MVFNNKLFAQKMIHSFYLMIIANSRNSHASAVGL
jgi:hypothetical protein